MRFWKRVVAVTLAISSVIFMSGLVTEAATKKKITSVSLKVTSNIAVGSPIDPDAVEVTTKSSRYSVDTLDFTNSGFSWEENSIPELEIELTADEDYIFSLKAGDVKLTGAQYVSARTRDSSTVLVVKVTLPSLSEQTGEISNSYWFSDTVAGWDVAIGAGYYEVKLFKDGKGIGGIKQVNSSTVDFGSEMTTAGSYNFQVRPVNKMKPENKGKWVEGPSHYIDSQVAEQLKIGGASWNQDQTGWWYRNLDGSFASNGWHLIGNRWYYFDAAGYMKTGWIEWNGAQYYCDSVNGDMWVNRSTPDGDYVGSDGIKIDRATWEQQQTTTEEETEMSWEEWNSQWKDKEDD